MAASFDASGLQIAFLALITLRRALPRDWNQVLLIQKFHRPVIGVRIRHRNIPRRRHLLHFWRGRSLTRGRGVDRLVKKRSRFGLRRGKHWKSLAARKSH